MRLASEIRVEPCEGALLVQIFGALTLENADAFRSLVLGKVHEGKALRGVVVDLCECDYLDSTGIGAFIVLKMKYKNAERLRLAKPTAVVARIFRATGFDLVMRVEPDVKTALAHLPEDAITL